MKRLALALVVLSLFVAPAAQAHDHNRFSLSFGIGGGGYHHHPHYEPYYPFYAPVYAYGYPTYYSPPPTVIYTQPVQEIETITAQPDNYEEETTSSRPTAHVDSKGRTCRQFQSVLDGASVNGTACLQPDGTWRTIGE